MSTATYERPLRAVPAPPEQRERFALVLAIRRRAEQSLNMLLALPRGAAGWALRRLRALGDAAREHRVLGWVGARLRGAVTLARAVGVVPLVGAVLSTPPVWNATQRLAAAAASGLAMAGRYLWTRAQHLLSRGGTTGQRIEHAMSRAGSAVSRAARAVAAHPAAPTVTHAAKAALRLVRPISQAGVAHQLLRLIPVQPVRFALELIILPLVLALGVPGQNRPRAIRTFPLPTMRPLDNDQPTTQATESAPPIGEAQAELDDSAIAEELADVARNRAERRAQQQEQARAKRARAHR